MMSPFNMLMREMANRYIGGLEPFEDAWIVRAKAKPGDLIEYQRAGYSVHKIHV